MDRPVAGLLKDLKARACWESTLVIWAAIRPHADV